MPGSSIEFALVGYAEASGPDEWAENIYWCAILFRSELPQCRELPAAQEEMPSKNQQSVFPHA